MNAAKKEPGVNYRAIIFSAIIGACMSGGVSFGVYSCNKAEAKDAKIASEFETTRKMISDMQLGWTKDFNAEIVPIKTDVAVLKEWKATCTGKKKRKTTDESAYNSGSNK